MGHRGYQAARLLRERNAHKRGGGRGADLPAGAPGSLADGAARHLAWLRERNYTEDGLESRHHALKNFLAWASQRSLENPATITLPILESYQRHLFHHRKKNGKPLGITTQRTRLTTLKSLFAWLVRQGEIGANPASDLQLPRPEKRLPAEPLSTPQIRALLAIPDTRDPLGIRDRAILETFYSTGLRRSELAHLQISDLNRERGTLQIRQGKGQKDRVVPIGGSAEKWLARYTDHVRPRLQLETTQRALFLTGYGGPFNPDVISRKVSSAMKKAEIGRPGSCHLLRHTCAAHMLEGGADIRQIQQLLGHEKLETTAIYTQVSILQLKEVHARGHPSGAGASESSTGRSHKSS